MTDIVIVGAGHSGGTAAAALRRAGFTGRLTVLGREAYPPYERPPLSKELLKETYSVESTFLKAQSWYEEAGIDLRLSASVTAIDRPARTVVLDDGAAVPYDRLLLTTGARARTLDVATGQDDRIVTVRDLSDALGLRAKLAAAKRVTIIGAGFIGLEIAAAARGANCDVTVIELAPQPLSRVVAPQVGAWFAELHRDQGTEMLTGTRVVAVEREGRRLGIVTADGHAIGADLVVVGIGAVPNVELAAAAGLDVDDGVVVNEFGRTADPAIFAAGDVTRHYNPLLGRRIRLESWQNAQDQALAVAKNMTAEPAPYASMPWFWTDQFKVHFQTVGIPHAWDRLVWRGDPAVRSFSVLYLHGDRLVAANFANRPREMRPVRRLLANNTPVDVERLEDPTVDLGELCRKPTQ